MQTLMDVCIIAAMDEEVSAMVACMESVKKVDQDGFTLYQGNIGAHQIMVVKSGIGKINAAMTATYCLMKYHPKWVINIGSAGGLLDSQAVGDLLVSKRVLSHDLDIGPGTENDARFQYEADQTLIETVISVLDDLGQAYECGLIVSGDQFVTHDSYAFNRIQALYPKAIGVEMEATAVAAVCTQFKTPFVVIRSLSDVPLHKNNEQTFEEYLEHASKQSAAICALTIKKARL